MKALPPFCLLAALLLAATPTLRAQSVGTTHSYLNYSPPTGELLDEEAELQMCDFGVARHAAQVSATSLPADQSLQQRLEQLTQENLALDFRIGTLQVQVEMLSRRLATLENTVPIAKAYNSQPR